MKTACFALLLVSWFALPAQAKENRHETEHFAFVYEDGAVTESGLAMAAEMGEAYHAALAEMLGHAPEFQIQVLLKGPAQQPDGSWGYPRVDGLGRVYLYQYTSEDESYFNAFAHELVHVFRIHRQPHNDWFFEEGFAEFVSLRVHDSLDGFPWYGYPVDVVAGQWIAAGEDMPLEVMRERHRELNLPCKLQTYSLRSAFFDDLGREHGDEKVLAMAGKEKAGALADYEAVFGESFDKLSAAWRDGLLERYQAMEGAEDQAKAYRTKSPAQYMPVCAEGEDY